MGGTIYCFKRNETSVYLRMLQKEQDCTTLDCFKRNEPALYSAAIVWMALY